MVTFLNLREDETNSQNDSGRAWTFSFSNNRHGSTSIWIFFFFLINVELAFCIPRFHIRRVKQLWIKKYFFIRGWESAYAKANSVHCYEPFYVRELSPFGFWYPQGPWFTKGRLEFRGNQRLYAILYCTRVGVPNPVIVQRTTIVGLRLLFKTFLLWWWLL